MKFIIAFTLLPAIALANPLLISIETGPSIQAGQCKEDLRYCGSWLVGHDGFSLDDLKKGCKENCSKEELENTLFTCQHGNHIEKVRHCNRGCIEEGGDQEDDICDTFRAKQNEKEATLRIEI